MRGRKILYAYGIAVLLYVALTFFILPPNPDTMERFDLTAGQVRLLNLTVVIPLLVIWGAAFYGYAKLRRYSDTIKPSLEGRPTSIITNGIMVLAYGLPIASIVNSLLRYIGQHNDNWASGLTIATNYVSMVFPLVAFILISIGVNKLTGLRKQRVPRRAIHLLVLFFAALSVMYSYLVVHHAFAGDPSSGSVYRMPLWLVLSTLVVPHLYTWFIGVVAASELFVYNANLKGVIYRKSWSRVSQGLWLIILSQVSIQCLTSLTRQLTQLQVSKVFTLVYALLFMMAAGYILLALGLKKLQQIEEV